MMEDAGVFIPIAARAATRRHGLGSSSGALTAQMQKYRRAARRGGGAGRHRRGVAEPRRNRLPITATAPSAPLGAHRRDRRGHLHARAHRQRPDVDSSSLIRQRRSSSIPRSAWTSKNGRSPNCPQSCAPRCIRPSDAIPTVTGAGSVDSTCPPPVDFAMPTHAHWDHVCGLLDFPGLPVHLHRAEHEWVSSGPVAPVGGRARFAA